ncbi:S24 family peptidase [Snodgrassella alvi]|nr:LexA family transcriptional regulator [Snodgrassella alvi]
MKTLSERIKYRLNELNKTQAGLCRYCKIKAPSVSKWLSGMTKTLKGENLLRAAEYLECDPDWLATGKGFWHLNVANSSEQATQNENLEYQAIPEFELLAITPLFLNEFIISTSDIQSSISSIHYTEEQYRRMFGAKEPQNLRITNIKADNMSGTLEPGDLVFVDTSIIKYDGDGIYLFVFSNHLHLKRVQMVGNTLMVISDNSKYQTWSITQKDKSNMNVLGKVLISQSQIFQRF